MRPSVAIFALAGALLAGCSHGHPGDEGQPPPECRAREAFPLDLLGERARVEVGEGAFLPSFDARSTPYVRVRGERPATWRMRLVATSTVPERTVTARTVSGGSAVEATTVATRAPAGPSLVELGAVQSSTRAGARGTLTFLRVAAWPEIPPGAWILEVSSARPGCPHTLAARWALTWGPPPEDLPPIAAARPLKESARYEDARRLLEPALDARDPAIRVWVSQEIARTYQAEGRLEESADAWKRSAELALAAKMPTQASWALRSAAFQCYWLRCFTEAEPLLDRAEALDRTTNNELGLARTSYYRGVLALNLGAYRRARNAMDEARWAARELGRPDDEARHSVMVATMLEREGRTPEAIAALTRFRGYLERVSSPADRSKVTTTLGWLRLRTAERALADGEAPPRAEIDALLDELERARDEIAELKDPLREANARLNLAEAAYVGSRSSTDAPELLRRARAELDAIRTLTAGARVLRTPHATLVDGLVLVAEGRLDEAERTFARLEPLSREDARGLESDYTWRAHQGLAAVYLARGERARATKALLRATEILHRVAKRTMLKDGLATFFEERRRVVEDVIDLLSADRRDRDAFVVADRARAEVFAALDTEVRAARLSPAARASWSELVARYARLRDAFDRGRKDEDLLAGAAQRAFRAARAAEARALQDQFEAIYAFLEREAPELSPTLSDASRLMARLGPGDALVEYVQVHRRWRSFFVTRDHIAQAEVGARALEPWTSALAGVRHLYVVDGGFVPARRLLTEPLDDGRRVLDRATVAYLPHAAILLRTPVEPKPEASALVVADPSENLPFAREEGRAAAKYLKDAQVIQGSGATRAAVLSSLATARHFHFAGHGVLEDSDPWAAHLELAGRETLALEDLLVLRPSAAVVVLSGCDTAREQALSANASIGLAQIFLIAGAGGVLATERPIGDADGARFVARFYAAGGVSRPRAAFREACLQSIAAGDDAWTAFRWFGTT